MEYVDYRDTGPGIEPRLIASEVIFEPEFSTKPGGHGLGLAIAGEAATRNGLELKAFESASGAYFRLQPKIEVMNVLRLLVVEDNEDDLRVCRDSVDIYRLAKKQDIQLTKFKTLDDAFDKLDNSFDGAIIDVRVQGWHRGKRSRQADDRFPISNSSSHFYGHACCCGLLFKCSIGVFTKRVKKVMPGSARYLLRNLQDRTD